MKIRKWFAHKDLRTGNGKKSALKKVLDKGGEMR